jgi:hypothetical protein
MNNAQVTPIRRVSKPKKQTLLDLVKIALRSKKAWLPGERLLIWEDDQDRAYLIETPDGIVLIIDTYPQDGVVLFERDPINQSADYTATFLTDYRKWASRMKQLRRNARSQFNRVHTNRRSNPYANSKTHKAAQPAAARRNF